MTERQLENPVKPKPAPLTSEPTSWHDFPKPSKSESASQFLPDITVTDGHTGTHDSPSTDELKPDPDALHTVPNSSNPAGLKRPEGVVKPAI